jgi:hypothetical protein
MSSNKRNRPDSGEDISDDVAMHVGQSVVPSLVSKCEFLVMDAQLMENRGL